MAQLEIEARNPKEGLLATLKSYREVDGGRVGGVQARVAPTVLARLYKSGRGARAELDDWLRQKELIKCSIASEVYMLGAVLDKMMSAGEFDSLINSQAAELTCLRLYSIFKAYELVEQESDWRRPKSANGSKWKSKVNWAYAEEFLDLARQTSPGVLAADDEVAERLKRKAAISKHLGGLGEAGGRGHADE